MFNKIILKNFKSNLHNYILFFISNIVAVAEMIAFWGMNDIVTKAITDKVTAAALKNGLQDCSRTHYRHHCFADGFFYEALYSASDEGLFHLYYSWHEETNLLSHDA